MEASNWMRGEYVCKTHGGDSPFMKPPAEIVERTEEKEKAHIRNILAEMAPKILEEILFERQGEACIEIGTENGFFMGAWTQVCVRCRVTEKD